MLGRTLATAVVIVIFASNSIAAIPAGTGKRIQPSTNVSDIKRVYESVWSTLSSGKQPFEDSASFSARKATEIGSLVNRINSNDALQITVAVDAMAYSADEARWLVPIGNSSGNSSRDNYAAFKTWSKSGMPSNLAEEIRNGPFLFIPVGELPKEIANSPMGKVSRIPHYGFLVVSGLRKVMPSLVNIEGRYYLSIPMSVDDAKRNPGGIMVTVKMSSTFPYAVNGSEHAGGNYAVGRFLTGQAANDKQVALDVIDRQFVAVEISGYIVNSVQGEPINSVGFSREDAPLLTDITKFPTYPLVDSNPSTSPPTVYGRGKSVQGWTICYMRIDATAPTSTTAASIEDALIRIAADNGAEAIVFPDSAPTMTGQRAGWIASLPASEDSEKQKLSAFACKYPKTKFGAAFKFVPTGRPGHQDFGKHIVTEVVPGSVADRLGLKPGYSVVRFSRKSVWNRDETFTFEIEYLLKKPNEKVFIEWDTGETNSIGQTGFGGWATVEKR